MTLRQLDNGFIMEATTKKAFELKGSLFALTVIQLYQTDIESIDNQLKKITANAPKLFDFTPVALDLNEIKEKNPDFNFKELKKVFLNNKLIIAGVRAAKPELKQLARDNNLGIFTTHQQRHGNANQRKTSNKKVDKQESTTKIVKHPVRSGQRIYSGGDLILLAPVSAGAEVLAEGNIHAYQSMRGRAMAGISGNAEACIFCQELSAELVAIAGIYSLNENIKAIKGKNGVQIKLIDEKLEFVAI